MFVFLVFTFIFFESVRVWLDRRGFGSMKYFLFIGLRMFGRFLIESFVF